MPNAESRFHGLLEARRPGGGEGDRSHDVRRHHPDYRQVSAYIHKEVYRRFKIRLAAEEEQLSRIAERLFAVWATDPEILTRWEEQQGPSTPVTGEGAPR